MEDENVLELIRTYTNPRSRRGCIIVGILFAFAVVVGGELYRSNSLAGLASSPLVALGNLGLALAVGIVAAVLALLVSMLQTRLADHPPRSVPAPLATHQATLVMGIVLFLCWLPCLLAYWPGLLTYDIPTQTDFIFDGHWTTQQPPLHTLIWAVFLKLEGACGLHAITWYSLAQMAFLAAAFAHLLSFLARRGTCLVVWIIAAVFCALNPVVALFAVTPVKDTILAGVLVFVLVALAQFIANPREFTTSKVRCAGLVIGLLVCCLLRENMLVAVAVFALIALVAFKGSRKAVAALCGAPLVCALVIIGPVYSALDISAGSSAIASVPIQQVANVVRNHYSELSEDDLAIVNAVLPANELEDVYNPRFADTTVRQFKGRHADLGGMRESIVAFLGLWASFIPRYPLDMLDAFADELVARHVVRLEPVEDGCVLSPMLAAERVPLLRRVVFKVLESLLDPDDRVETASVEAIINAFERGRPKSGYVVNIQGNLAVSSNKQGVRIEPMAAFRTRRRK